MMAALLLSTCAFHVPTTYHAGHGFQGRIFMSSPEPVSQPSPPPVEPKSYDEAEKLGLSLFAAGDFDGAMKRFEQAKGLPGAGYDVIRAQPGAGIQGDKSQPPNPRGLQESRFASPAQLAIAEYNIACCKLKLGQKEEAVERLQAFVNSVDNPGRQFERMLSDPDLAEIKQDILAMQEELKSKEGWNPFAGIKKMFNVEFVEWK